MTSGTLVLNWVWLLASSLALGSLGFVARRVGSGPLLAPGAVAGFFVVGLALTAGRPIIIDPFIAQVRAALPPGSANITDITVFLVMAATVVVAVLTVFGLGYVLGSRRSPAPEVQRPVHG